MDTTSLPRLHCAERLLVFGGPYSNRQATQALLAEAARLGIAPREMLCTGDLVAYCAEPQATVDLIRQAGIATIMGNCEESLALEAEDCGCGFEEGTLCDLLSAQWYSYSRQRLDPETKAWMGTLPRHLVVEIAGRRLLAIHGGVSQMNRMIFAASPREDISDELDAAGLDGVIGGHSGIPFAALDRGRLWLNAGAIGMPANDGTPRVWFALLGAEGADLTVEIRALAYDHAGAAGKMRQEGLANGYAGCLETGLWPSLDVLPEAARAATGVPLAESRLVWRGERALAGEPAVTSSALA